MLIPQHLQSYGNTLFSSMMSMVVNQGNKSHVHNMFASMFMANNGSNPVCQRACEYALAFVHAVMSNNQNVDAKCMSDAANFGAYMTLMETILTNASIRQYATQEQMSAASAPDTQARFRDFGNLINNLFNSSPHMPQQQQFMPVQQQPQVFGIPMNTPMPASTGYNPNQNLMFPVVATNPIKSVLDSGNVITDAAKEILDRASAKVVPVVHTSATVNHPVEQVYTPRHVIKDPELGTYFEGSDMDKKAHSLFIHGSEYEVYKTVNDNIESGIDLLKVANQNSQDVADGENPSLSMDPINGVSLSHIIKDTRIKMAKTNSLIYRVPYNLFRSVVGSSNTVDMVRKMTQVSSIDDIVQEQKKQAQSINMLASQPKMTKAISSALNTLMVINGVYSKTVISVLSRYSKLISLAGYNYNLSDFVFSSDITEFVKVMHDHSGSDPDLYKDIHDKLTQSLISCVMLTDEWPPARSAEEREGYIVNSFYEPGVLTCVDFNSVEFGYKVTREWSTVGGVSTTMLQRLIASAYKHFNMSDIQPRTHLIVTSDLRVYEYAVRFRNDYVIRDITDYVM